MLKILRTTIQKKFKIAITDLEAELRKVEKRKKRKKENLKYYNND